MFFDKVFPPLILAAMWACPYKRQQLSVKFFGMILQLRSRTVWRYVAVRFQARPTGLSGETAHVLVNDVFFWHSVHVSVVICEFSWFV
jgi:hypothetical protein